ncbi:MAG TPA: T9SS type A sorting domain-containing protein [Flavipsychrobacter sp.]
MSYNRVSGQTANVASNFSDTLLCVNGNFTVPITVSSTPFDDTNVFRIEISNATGSFANPVIVGYAYGNGIGTTVGNCTLPPSITAGTGYRLRIVTNHPAYTSGPNNKNIRVSDLPTVTAASNGPLCEGDMLNLTATSSSPAPTFNWVGPGGWNATNVQNPSRPGVTTNDTGKYIVTITSYKCSSKDTVDLLVVPQPNITEITANSPVCEGSELKIDYKSTVSGSIRNSWTYPDNTTRNLASINVFNAKPSDAGKYIVKIEVGSCWDTMSVTVVVKPTPDTPTATNNGPLCVGETLTVDGSSSTPGVTYRWEAPDGTPYSGTPLTVPNISKTQEGEWKLFAMKDGCDSKPGITEVKIGIPLVPLPVSGDTMLCPGDKLQLSAQAATTQGIEWKKLPNDSTIISISRTYGKNPVTPEDAGLYVVTQEVLGCKSPPSYINVIVPDIKNPTPKNNGPVCIGEKLELTAVGTNNGTYSWIGPDGFTSNAQNPTLNSVTATSAGIYTITTKLEYCEASDTTHVTVKPMPEVTGISSNSPVCNYTYLNLFAQSSLDNSTFTWTGPDTFKSTEQNPSRFYTDNVRGTYTARAIKDGCISAPVTTEVISREGPGTSRAGNNGPMKEGELLELFAENDKDSVMFYWTGPNGFTSNEQNPRIQVATARNSGKYELFSVYNGCTTSTFTVVDVKDILGITLQLYPNPNDGRFTVTGITQTDAQLEITIFNHQGMTMYHGLAKPENAKFKTEIDMRGVASGVYILQLIQEAERKRIRFTVVRQ